MRVIAIPLFEDNYCYYVYTHDIKKGFIVDAADYNAVKAFLHAREIEPTHVLTTHKHWDHSGANEELKKNYPALEILGGEDDSVPGCTVPLKDGAKIEIHGMHVHARHASCHTKGHMLYYVTDDPDKLDESEVKAEINAVKHEDSILYTDVNRAIFTGDTLFIGGCGKFFEGNAGQMLHAMDIIRNHLPDTKIFCGHEYTVKNLEFAQQVLPDNEDIKKKFEWASEMRKKGFYTVPSLLYEEVKYNVFMRCREKDIQSLLGTEDPEKCMHLLREWKNGGAKPKL